MQGEGEAGLQGSDMLPDSPSDRDTPSYIDLVSFSVPLESSFGFGAAWVVVVLVPVCGGARRGVLGRPVCL